MGPRNDPSAGNKATGARLFRRQPMDSWRNDPGDRMQYWIAHGGGRSATASASIPNPVSALRSPSPTASITSSVKADSGIGISSVSESGAATQVVHDVPRSCLERAISIRDDLAADTGSNDAIAVPTHIRDSIRDLTLDLVPNTPSQHPIFPQGSTSSRGSASEHRRSSSSFGSSRSKKQGKRPARDCDNTYGSRCEPLTQVQETNEKAKKPGLRCFYHFAPEPNDRCGCNQRFISRLIRHLAAAHRVFFCVNCSQCFLSQEPFSQHFSTHRENRVCIDIECENKAANKSFHSLVNSCTEFQSMDTWRKYRSLFAFLLPGTDIPAENDVYVLLDDDDIDVGATLDSIPELPGLMDFTGLGDFPPDNINNVGERPFGDVEQSMAMNQSLFPVPNSIVSNNADDQRLSLMQQRQNDMQTTIDEQSTTIAQQGATIRQQNIIIHEERVHREGLEQTVLELRSMVEEETTERGRLQNRVDHLIRLMQDAQFVDPARLQTMP